MDLVVLFCTPLSLDELAVGHLVGRGLLRERAELASVAVCADDGLVEVARAGAPPLPRGNLEVVASACGSGTRTERLLGLDDGGTLPPGEPVSLALLAEGARRMFEAADLHRSVGGMHCSAIFPMEAGSRLIVREDVGRHNAVDKVLGRAWLEGLDSARCAILTSGRIAADMVAKAYSAGVSIIASRSVATSSAYDIATRRGMTLLGRIVGHDPIIYCGGERLSDQAD